jgi:hypothetical protein
MGTEARAGGRPPSDPIEVVRAIASEAIMHGAAPGDVAQAVLELCAEEPRQPFGPGERDRCLVTTMIEPTGVFEQKIMGPDADYVLTLGPNYELTYTNESPTTGSVQLTIKRRGPDVVPVDEVEAKRAQGKPDCATCGHPYAIHRGVDGGEGCFYSGGADQAVACSCRRYELSPL